MPLVLHCFGGSEAILPQAIGNGIHLTWLYHHLHANMNWIPEHMGLYRPWKGEHSQHQRLEACLVALRYLTHSIHALSSQGFPNWSVGRFWDALADQLTWQGTYHVFQLWVSCFLKNPRYPSVGSLKGSQQNQVMSNPPLAVPATIVKPLLALPACRLSTHLQPILLLQPPVQVQNPD